MLLDGEHDIERTFEVALEVWAQTFKFLADQNVRFCVFLILPVLSAGIICSLMPREIAADPLVSSQAHSAPVCLSRGSSLMPQLSEWACASIQVLWGHRFASAHHGLPGVDGSKHQMVLPHRHLTSDVLLLVLALKSCAGDVWGHPAQAQPGHPCCAGSSPCADLQAPDNLYLQVSAAAKVPKCAGDVRGHPAQAQHGDARRRLQQAGIPRGGR